MTSPMLLNAEFGLMEADTYIMYRIISAIRQCGQVTAPYGEVTRPCGQVT
jgi:hypothetical protein